VVTTVEIYEPGSRIALGSQAGRQHIRQDWSVAPSDDGWSRVTFLVQHDGPRLDRYYLSTQWAFSLDVEVRKLLQLLKSQVESELRVGEPPLVDEERAGARGEPGWDVVVLRTPLTPPRARRAGNVAGKIAGRHGQRPDPYRSPTKILGGVAKEAADDAARELRAAGCSVQVRPSAPKADEESVSRKDLVELERFAASWSRGQISAAEFQSAKRTVLGSQG
jgi:hypothetical protein